MSHVPSRSQFEFAEKHPHPGEDPMARLAHVVDLFADTPDYEWAVMATSNAYPDGGKTGLTYGDLRALLALVRTERGASTMKQIRLTTLPEPCEWCRPGWLAWTAEIARQTEDNEIGQDARRYAEQHAHHIQTLCARLHHDMPYYESYLCEWVDADRVSGPVGCDNEPAPGKRFCQPHVEKSARFQALSDDMDRDTGVWS